MIFKFSIFFFILKSSIFITYQKIKYLKNKNDKRNKINKICVTLMNDYLFIFSEDYFILQNSFDRRRLQRLL